MAAIIRWYVFCDPPSKSAGSLPRSRSASASIAGRLPRPVRRIEMQTEQKGLAGTRIIADHLYGMIAEKVCGITRLGDWSIIVPEIGRSGSARVQIVIHGAAAITVEMVVPTFQWAEVGEIAEMPFTDQRSAIAGAFGAETAELGVQVAARRPSWSRPRSVLPTPPPSEPGSVLFTMATRDAVQTGELA